MSRRGRWDYMAQPGYNPPVEDCPECEQPSKCFYIGSKTEFREDGTRVKVTRRGCEHGHRWEDRE